MAVAVAQPLYHNEKHKENLLQDLNRERFETDSFCDATLQVDGKTYNIHKCIVGKTSSFFRKLFQVEMKEKYDSFANLKGLTSDIIESVLNFIYTGSIGINDENVFDLLAAANFLLVDGLRLCCRDFLTSNINVGNCVKYFSIGKKNNWILLERKAAKIMSENYKEIMEQEDFMFMEEDIAVNFFSGLDQSISAFVAKDIYEGIVAWVKHNVEERKSSLLEMLRFVRFKRFPDQYLDSIKKEALIKENDQIIDFLNEETKWKNLSLQHKDGRNACKNVFVIFDKIDVWLFDLFTTTWRKLPVLPIDATGSCFAGYLDHLYVIGGIGDSRVIRHISLVDEEADWKIAGHTLQDRINSSAIVTDDMIVISGGGTTDKNSTSSVETYSNVGPKVQQSQVEPMVYNRYKHSMVKCSGSMYCFGDFVVVKKKSDLYEEDNQHRGFRFGGTNDVQTTLGTSSGFSFLSTKSVAPTFDTSSGFAFPSTKSVAPTFGTSSGFAFSSTKSVAPTSGTSSGFAFPITKSVTPALRTSSGFAFPSTKSVTPTFGTSSGFAFSSTKSVAPTSGTSSGFAFPITKSFAPTFAASSGFAFKSTKSVAPALSTSGFAFPSTKNCAPALSTSSGFDFPSTKNVAPPFGTSSSFPFESTKGVAPTHGTSSGFPANSLKNQNHKEVRNDAPTEIHDNQAWKVLNARSFSSCVAVASKRNIFVIDSEKRMHLYSPEFEAWKSCATCPFNYVDHQTFAASYMDEKVFAFGRVTKHGEEATMKYVLAEYDITENMWTKKCSFPCNLENSFISSV